MGRIILSKKTKESFLEARKSALHLEGWVNLIRQIQKRCSSHGECSSKSKEVGSQIKCARMSTLGEQ